MRISDWSSDVCSSDLSHTIKAGYVQSDNDYTEDTRYTGADSALYRSIAIGDSGATFDEFTGAGWTGTRSIVAGDTTRIITATSEEHTSALQSLMRLSYAVSCFKKKKKHPVPDTQLIHRL